MKEEDVANADSRYILQTIKDHEFVPGDHIVIHSKDKEILAQIISSTTDFTILEEAPFYLTIELKIIDMKLKQSKFTSLKDRTQLMEERNENRL